MLVDKLVSVYNFKSFDDEMDIIFETLEKTLKTVFADVKSLI